MSTPEKNDAGAVSKAEVEPAVGGDAAVGETPASEAPRSDDAPKPSSQKEVNRTIQLDIAQVDLLDVPLPPSSAPKVSEETSTTGKGPPPLPPVPPPSPEASAPVAPAAQVSARKLVEGSAPAGSPSAALRFALGLGAATVVCVGLWFGVRALRKPPPASPPAPAVTASAPASSAPEAPMRTITIAPIEMSGPALGPADSASASPSASPSAKQAPASSASARPAATHGASSGSPSGGTSKPKSSDDVIKVEN